jgi:hypothetical protein
VKKLKIDFSIDKANISQLFLLDKLIGGHNAKKYFFEIGL